MKIAVMQPYFFPYIGYFQLISAVDKFVLYDDVNFQKRGWINRNRILVNDIDCFITVPLKEASQFKLINEIKFLDNRQKMMKTIQMAYKKAPFFDEVFPIIEDVLSYSTDNISELAAYSVNKICNYLYIITTLENSSELYSDLKSLDRSDRLKSICKTNNAKVYINSIGGKELYFKDDFKKSEIDLFFLNSKFRTYNQFGSEFIPGLSIIDVLMFNSKTEVISMLNDFELE